MALFGRPTPEDEAKAIAYRQWLEARNPWAIASTVLGVFSFIEMGVLIVLGVAGIVTGIVALMQLKEPSPSRPHGRRLAWTGISLSVLSLVCASILYSRVLG
jgi:hypothetical protein